MSTAQMDPEEWTLALVTESLRVRKLQDKDPIPVPANTQEDAQRWLDRHDTWYGLLNEVEDLDPDEIQNLVVELVGFATTSLEVWAALHTQDPDTGEPHDPQTLLQAVALGRVAGLGSDDE